MRRRLPLAIPAAAQFVMVLDSSVMNVSIGFTRQLPSLPSTAHPET